MTQTIDAGCGEQLVTVGQDIDLCFETFGDRGDPPLLLIMGLGMQMLSWDARFCEHIAARGFFVIRFDNRDAGRSTHLSAVRSPTIAEVIARRMPKDSYRLCDMARDAAGLLTALELADAHVVGASMGGMIAQTIAALHPERVRSLTSIMASTGARWTGQPSLRAYPIILRRPPTRRAAYIDRMLNMYSVVACTSFDRDLDEVRRLLGESFDRGCDPRATRRQLAAIIASGDRRRQLRSVCAPTLVIHSDKDLMVAPSGARATAAAISGARLLIVPGLGHDLPSGAWPNLIAAITDHADVADAEGPERRRSRAPLTTSRPMEEAARS